MSIINQAWDAGDRCFINNEGKNSMKKNIGTVFFEEVVVGTNINPLFIFEIDLSLVNESDPISFIKNEINPENTREIIITGVLDRDNNYLFGIEPR